MVIVLSIYHDLFDNMQAMLSVHYTSLTPVEACIYIVSTERKTASQLIAWNVLPSFKVC